MNDEFPPPGDEHLLTPEGREPIPGTGPKPGGAAAPPASGYVPFPACATWEEIELGRELKKTLWWLQANADQWAKSKVAVPALVKAMTDTAGQMVALQKIDDSGGADPDLKADTERGERAMGDWDDGQA